MAKQTINIGASANDGTGTPLRTAFDYCNLNFTELYTAVGPSGNNIVCPGSATAQRFIPSSATVPTNGMYLPAANELGWAINSAEAMRLNSNGLGLGVTPSAGKGALQLSSGINFPATQVASSDANTLDDYEEGTWTPVITAGSGTPTTVTINSAVYTKIGRVVVCTFDFSIVNKGTAGSSLQFGLPVTSITSTAFCGSFREDGSTGNMGMVFYSTGTTAACLLYNNATPWVDGYRLKGSYTYFSA
jgi:hypothetical protein